MTKVPYTFKLLAAEVLSKVGRPLTAEEIWESAVAHRLSEKLRGHGKTPVATLYADLHRATLPGSESDFIRVGNRPRRYWLLSRGEFTAAKDEPTPPAPTTTTGVRLRERDLHPLLAWFADSRLAGVLVKTIHHEKSRKSSLGEWVHPDLIGVLFPQSALGSPLTMNLSNAMKAPLCRLFSFELKCRVDFANLREVFFQTVSNSSWANEAYLVSAEWDDSPEFREELDRLCQAFGIGTIHLSVEDPQSSSIRIPALRKLQIDWSTLDKLIEMNADVQRFVKTVTDDLGTSVHRTEFDPVPADPELYVETLKSSGTSPPGR